MRRPPASSAPAASASACAPVLGFALAALLLSPQAWAGTVVPEQEYDKYIDKHRTVQPMDFALFGEQVNLRDGGVSFRVTDVELAGNGPPIRVTRTFRLRENNRFVDNSGNDLAGWSLEIPRLKTITSAMTRTQSSSPYGWQVPGSNKNARCSNFAAPGPILFADPDRYWEPHEWWSGYQLVDDQGSEQELLALSSTSLPEVAGYKAVTTGNWRFSCLTSTSNGEPGEGFLGAAPDGTRYWFTHLVYTNADSMTKEAGGTPSFKGQDKTPSPERIAKDYLLRRHAMMLVTRVEDRFGNWLKYDYSGALLLRITSSDGRLLEVDRSQVPVKVSTNSGTARRTWTYASGSPSRVTLPDGSAWTYNFAALTAANIGLESVGAGSCDVTTSNVTGNVQGSATSPSGVTGSFEFTLKRFGRSHVLRECIDPNGDGVGFAAYPVTWVAYALTKRTFSGPGMAPQSWTYVYSTPNASWSTCTTCVSEVWSDVTEPDGVRQRSVFSNRFDETENQLLREETYSSANSLVRTVRHEYATFPAFSATSPYAWPQFIGADLQAIRVNRARTERWAPPSRKRIEQQGRIFTWEVPSTCGSNGTSPCFDRFSRPIKVVKSSSP